MFEHEPPAILNYEPLSVSYKNGTRYYEVEPGVTYPSMTSVWSILSRDSIAKWKARVGEQKAEAKRDQKVEETGGDIRGAQRSTDPTRGVVVIKIDGAKRKGSVKALCEQHHHALAG